MQSQGTRTLSAALTRHKALTLPSIATPSCNSNSRNTTRLSLQITLLTQTIHIADRPRRSVKLRPRDKSCGNSNAQKQREGRCYKQFRNEYQKDVLECEPCEKQNICDSVKGRKSSWLLGDYYLFYKPEVRRSICLLLSPCASLVSDLVQIN